MSEEAQDGTARFTADVKARMASAGAGGAGDPLPFQRRARGERLQLAQHLRRVWAYVAPAGIAIEEVMKPEFWQPVSRGLTVWDRIEVVEEAGAFYAELLVVSIGPHGAVLAGIRGVELHGQTGVRDAALQNTIGATIHYRGPFRKWTVEAGEEVLKEECATQAEAGQWLHNHLRARQ